MSQIRCNIEDSDHRLVGWIIPNVEVILKDGGIYEVWAKKDDFAGYVIVIDGEGYEFVGEAKSGDLWWAGVPQEELDEFNKTMVNRTPS